MKILSSLKSLFRLTEEEKGVYERVISQENTRRAFYLALVAIPVSLVHIILFVQKLKVVTGINRQWALSIVFTHLSLLIVSALGAILLYFFSYRDGKNTLPARICTKVLLIFVLVLGTTLAAFDQYVTPAITPFLITTLLVALFFHLRPVWSTLYFTASYIIFYFAVSATQSQQEILTSNLVNGLSITAISLSLSIILSRSKLTRIRQSEQITRQNQALSESNAEKDKFFSIIAHDLKSPFNSILGFSDLLIEQVKEKNYDGIDKAATIIHESSKSAMDLLMNLMEWSNSQTGRMEFNPENIVLNELVQESEYLFTGALLQKGQTLSFHIPEQAVVHADRNMVRTILRNLISNAIKFTDADGLITLEILKNQEEYLISVSDTGVGIPAETINRLFRIDQNNSTLGTRNEKGTGLGLILCKELIDRHGGKIWGKSEPGKGSTFYFTLPAG